jgi:hypothetical protein
MKTTPRSCLMAMSRRPKAKKDDGEGKGKDDEEGGGGDEDDDGDKDSTGAQDVMGPVPGDNGEMCNDDNEQYANV